MSPTPFIPFYFPILLSCATTQQDVAPLNKDIAVIKGKKENFLKSALLPLGTKVNINIYNVDRQQMGSFMSGPPTRIEVAPGKHMIKVNCLKKWGQKKMGSEKNGVRAQFTLIFDEP